MRAMWRASPSLLQHRTSGQMGLKKGVGAELAGLCEQW